MKILLLRQYNPFVESGASANRFRGLIEGLRTLGHMVDVAVTGGYISPNDRCKRENNIIYLSKANHYSYWQARLNTYIFDPIHAKAATHRLSHLNLSSYDIIWLTNSSTILKTYIEIKDSLKAKTFIELNEFNDIYKEAGHTGNILQRIKGRNSNDSFKNAVEYIDLFGVMTKTLLTYYQSMAKPDAGFMHLPMTVDLKRFENVDIGTGYERPYIAFTGTFNNAKDGVDVLIKAFSKIADKYPTLNLYLAGFWHYDVSGQEAMIKQFGLESRIHYLGVLNREQVPPFICNASVLALSRPDSHQAQGGFPTKLGEYLATGNPVCVTKVGEIPNYLEDNVSAFMAIPGDVDSFADALDRALSDSENAKRVGMNGRKVAEENFDARKQARRLSDFMLENLK